jgi:hypothetical protein
MLSMSLLCQAQPQVELKWSELGARAAGHKVALVLPEGTHVEGKVRAVEPHGLRMRVSKTSDRRVVRKGDQIIPRQSISVVRVTEYRKLGRLLVTTGTVGAASALVATNYPDIYEGPAVIAVPAVVAAGLIGLGIGAYFIGKRIDRTVTEIRVVPEP